MVEDADGRGRRWLGQTMVGAVIVSTALIEPSIRGSHHLGRDDTADPSSEAVIIDRWLFTDH